MEKRTIMIVAGEPSGDLHGSNLMRNLKLLLPSVQFVGAGGKMMKKEGLEEIVEMKNLAIIGFREVFGKIRLLKKNLYHLSRVLKNNRPDCFIPIDYPGFNLRLIKVAKAVEVPVFYYISPQVWAWGKYRLKTLRKCVDKLFVVLPFEKEFYSYYGIKAEFFGHPLLDIVKLSLTKEGAFSFFHFGPNKPLIGLMPGSRWEEVRLSLPAMVEACRIIAEKVPDAQFGIVVAESIDPVKIEFILGGKNKFQLIKTNSYDFMNLCDVLLVNSGTATLEAAILGIPMVIIYKMSFFSWLLAKMLVRIPHFGLVNIVAGEKIVPEFLQFGVRPPIIAKEALSMLIKGERRETIKRNLERVKLKLGEEGAGARVAKIIYQKLNEIKH